MTAALVVLVQSACDEAPATAAFTPMELVVGPEFVSIGVEDQPAEYSFGEVEDVLPVRDGLLVADHLNHILRLFSLDGTFLTETGREGEGPGEFKRISGLAASSDSTVLVLDATLLRLTDYEVRADSIRHLRDLSLPFQAHDVCVLRDRVFLLGFYEDHAVHEIDPAGVVLRSFGDTSNPGPDVGGAFLQMLRSYNAMGHLACLEEQGLIVVLPHILPKVRAFSVEGRLVWQSTLTDYRATQFNLTERGTIQLGLDETSGTVHTSWGLFALGDSSVVVSLEERGWESRSYELRVLNLGDGRERGRLAHSPGLVAYRGGTAWHYEQEPFSRLGASTLSIDR